MIRPFKRSDTNELIEIFKLNTPKYFDINEVADFKDYLKENYNTYLTVELNEIIVGGTGYYVNKKNKEQKRLYFNLHDTENFQPQQKTAV